MSTTTYSFGDVALVISHPAVGQYVAHGVGLGTITITMSTERTAHDVSADGSIMVSKIEGNNGSMAIQIQQTSEFNKWLLNLYNYLLTAPSSEWAQISSTVRSPNMGDLVIASDVSFQQRAELSYQAQGQQRTWNMMAADITELNVA